MRAGFTLIEIMIALTIGAMAVGSIYAVGKNSNHYFQQQYRVSNTMTRLRVAMAQVKRDLQRAGYLATPNAAQDPVCAQPNVTPGALRYAGVMNLQEGVGTRENGVDPGEHYTDQLPIDSLWLLGNYETSSEYPGLSNPSGDGFTLQIDQWWHAFRRDFTNWHSQDHRTAVPLDMNRFNQVFTVGRPVRITTSGARRYHFATIASVVAPSAAGQPVSVTITPAVPQGCRKDIDKGWIAPLMLLEYAVVPELATGADNTIAFDPNDEERYPRLRRRERLIATGNLNLTGPNTIVLDYVVRFDVDFITANAGSNPEQINWAPNNQVVAQRPHDLRMARVTLSARSPGLDPTFLPLEPPSQPFRRFVIDPAGATRRPGAARVRTLRADIFLPNMSL